MKFQHLVDKISLNPKKLFLIDAFGALLSAFLLGVVLVRFKNIFGIPVPVLYFLALLPLTFAVYDFYCYFKVKQNIGLFLKGIAYINISYCCISMGLAFYHYNKITFLGWSYILIEVFILITLANFELSTAKILKKNY